MSRFIRNTFLLLSFFTAATFAADFKKGVHYVEVKGTLTQEKEVKEFFSFYCPACFQQEPFMKSVESALPAGAKFKKNHVDGMPGRTVEVEEYLTKALITAEILKNKAQIVADIFNTIHVKRSNFSSEADVKKLFTDRGIAPEKFDKTFNSFAVSMRMKKMKQNTASIRSQGFGAVPTLVINGKYKPVLNKIKTPDEYKKLITFLLNKTS